MNRAFIIIGISLLAAGCNSDPRCRREISLLRTEILDLEDKYYLIREQRDDALAILNSRTDNPQLAQRMAELNTAVQAPLQSNNYSHADYDEAPFEGEIYGSPVYEVEGGMIYNQGGGYGDELYYDDQVMDGVPQPTATHLSSPNANSMIESDSPPRGHEIRRETLEQIDAGVPVEQQRSLELRQPAELPLGQSETRTPAAAASRAATRNPKAVEPSQQPPRSTNRARALPISSGESRIVKPDWRPMR